MDSDIDIAVITSARDDMVELELASESGLVAYDAVYDDVHDKWLISPGDGELHRDAETKDEAIRTMLAMAGVIEDD